MMHLLDLPREGYAIIRAGSPGVKGPGCQEMLQARKERTRWSRLARGLLVLATLALAVYLSRPLWLTAIGSFLVQEDPLEKADVAIVLAGDGYGHRLMKAVELVRLGYAKQVLVDGPFTAYGYDEAEMAVGYAIKQGVPREILVPVSMRVRSTVAEAGAIDAELRKRGLASALVVTSNFHTRRARAVFRKYGSPGIRYAVIAARDEDFAPENWWQSRDAQKVLFFEYAKLVAWWLGY
jgi:uncharacterized SAM-binding protein YcdF (DUF218 family)